MDQFLDQYVFRYTKRYIGHAKLTKDGLLPYTKREEWFNTCSHLLGVLIGVGAVFLSIDLHHTEYGLAGGLIFGVALMIEYLASSIYHGIPMRYVRQKKRFRLFDHSAIFVLVAGSIAPFILIMIGHRQSVGEWLFYVTIWLVAVIGITLLCVNMNQNLSIATALYVVMGIAVVARIDDLGRLLSSTGMALFLAGGAVYLIGLLCYGLGSKRTWMHSVFHVLCIVGSLLHCACVYGYLI
ncbi:hemolysin III-like protein [Lacticaseibacillus paracasei subsp. paracasei Lpp227]|nr:hemolysin III-like protein [Lacticaseibacillus paracasei subsp. paracasei Lpp227]